MCDGCCRSFSFSISLSTFFLRFFVWLVNSVRVFFLHRMLAAGTMCWRQWRWCGSAPSDIVLSIFVFLRSFCRVSAEQVLRASLCSAKKRTNLHYLSRAHSLHSCANNGHSQWNGRWMCNGGDGKPEINVWQMCVIRFCFGICGHIDIVSERMGMLNESTPLDTFSVSFVSVA